MGVGHLTFQMVMGHWSTNIGQAVSDGVIAGGGRFESREVELSTNSLEEYI